MKCEINQDQTYVVIMKPLKLFNLSIKLCINNPLSFVMKQPHLCGTTFSSEWM